MRGLSERLRETVHVGMLDGAAVRFVAAVEGPPRCGWRRGWAAPCRRIARRPARPCWPSYRKRNCISCCPRRIWSASPTRSIGSRDKLEAELSRIREQGYAVNREESEEGVASVAVPIPTQAPGLRLALNAAAPQHRLSRSQYASVASRTYRVGQGDWRSARLIGQTRDFAAPGRVGGESRHPDQGAHPSPRRRFRAACRRRRVSAVTSAPARRG